MQEDTKLAFAMEWAIRFLDILDKFICLTTNKN